MSDEPVSPTPDTRGADTGDSLVELVTRVLMQGRDGLGRATRGRRLRAEIRRLELDRDHFWMRLGKTAYHLSADGEIEHPSLRKAIARLDELDARIGALRSRVDKGDL